eukprot:m.125901 g.125901  ORF g.125901 m.125901 type:complete len:65 (+) comp14504_c0_seq2:475-669(+)
MLFLNTLQLESFIKDAHRKQQGIESFTKIFLAIGMIVVSVYSWFYYQAAMNAANPVPHCGTIDT